MDDGSGRWGSGGVDGEADVGVEANRPDHGVDDLLVDQGDLPGRRGHHGAGQPGVGRGLLRTAARSDGCGRCRTLHDPETACGTEDAVDSELAD